MWNFFGSPQLNNFFSLLSLIILIFDRPSSGTSMKGSHCFAWSRRKILWLLLAVSFYSHGFYRTNLLQKSLQECQARPLIGFGTQNNRFWAQVNTQALEIRARGKPSNAILIARLSDKTIDENTDRTILKSHLVSIPDEVPMTRNMEVVLTQEILQRLPSAAGLMDARLYLLPNAVSSDVISCLADVKAHNGRLIAGGFYNIPYVLTPIPDAHEDKVRKAH